VGSPLPARIAGLHNGVLCIIRTQRWSRRPPRVRGVRSVNEVVLTSVCTVLAMLAESGTDDIRERIRAAVPVEKLVRRCCVPSSESATSELAHSLLQPTGATASARGGIQQVGTLMSTASL
jgi:hypothetical protein